MAKKQIDEKYFEAMSKAINVQQILNFIQCKSSGSIDGRSLLERERAARENMMRSFMTLKCNVKEISKMFEQYGEAIQKIYFDVGVHIGICMQSELLLQNKDVTGKGMTLQEFKDHLFDVINESDEILIQDVRVDEDLGEIVVKLYDGGEFIVRCESR